MRCTGSPTTHGQRARHSCVGWCRQGGSDAKPDAGSTRTAAWRCSAPDVVANVTVVVQGESHSFPDGKGLPDHVEGLSLPGMVVLGDGATLPSSTAGQVVAIELGLECLGVHAGESRGDEGSNVVGFARFRLGSGSPSNLVELVRQPHTAIAAVEDVAKFFRAAGMEVAVCADAPGRILNR